MRTVTIDNYESLLKECIESGEFNPLELRFPVDDKIFYYDLRFYTFLASHEDPNDTIFRVLGIDKYEFCDKVYGKRAARTDFPEYHGDDITMMYKIAYAIFDECKSRLIPVKKIVLDSLEEIEL